MKYTNADMILPESLVAAIQEYLQDGGLIYIPKATKTRAKWGEKTGSRSEIKERNAEMIKRFKDNESIDILASDYCLSVETIKKIVYKK